MTQLSAQRQDAVQAALKALNIKSGETVQAVIKSITPVDSQLRARLIQLTNPVTDASEAAVAKSTTSPDNPNIGGNRALPQLTAQLLQAKNLKLLELAIAGKSVIVFSDKPAKNGQQLNIQLHQGSFIVAPESKPSTAYTNHVKSAPNPVQTAGNTRPLSDQQKSVIQTELRSLIPILDPKHSNSPLSQALSSIVALKELLTGQALAPAAQQIAALKTLPRTLQESLQQLANQLRTPEQLSRPPLLKQALLNSGVQLESKLLTTATPEKLPQQDLKAGLLHTLAALAKTTSSPPPPLSSSTHSPSVNAANSSYGGPPGATTQPPNTLMLLLQQLTLSGTRQQNISLTAEQLVPQLQQQILQAINKMLYSQLQSITRSQPAADGQANQQIQLEIPIRYGHEVHALQVQLEEDWEQQPQEEHNGPNEKVRKWLVKLAFDLPEAGSLHAHITVIQDSVSTSLWADNSQTFDQLQTSVGQLKQRLEKDGCTVKKMECFAGKPNEETIQLGYALVDIKT
ncbi:MAG: flagellar hook-length control protein FliK [Cellvibrionaceae bacterium]